VGECGLNRLIPIPAAISYHGTMDSGTLLAGDVDPVAGTLTVQVRRTENPFDS
ncbi:unnamed protein product, partial [marine sediment metagenome]